MTDDRRRHQVLGGATRDAILAVLRAASRPMTLAELATAVGRHPNSVREQAQQLVAVGLIGRTPVPARGRGRPAWQYAALETDEDRDEDYRSLAEVLASQLARRPDATALSMIAGEQWGATLATTDRDGGRHDHDRAAARWTEGDPDLAIDRFVAILDEAGFAPDPKAIVGTVPAAMDGRPVGETADRRRADAPIPPLALRRCPFEAVARAQPGVVCSVHLGMMRGALRELGASIEVTALDPFVTPDTCLAHLARRPVP